MNKKVFLILSLVFLSFALQAQRGPRIGYIDMDYILENVPEYQEASKQLEDKVNRWKGEIETKLREVAEMKKQLNNERPLLTKELIEERSEEIDFEEKQILDYQQKRFGTNGDLAIQKRQLVEPVQDQVFNAIQEISVAKKYDYVFNKSDVVMLFSADRHDMSDQVIRSITRSAKRKQIKGKKEENAFDKDESRTIEQDKEILERQKAIEDKKSEREALLEERAKEREAQKAERQRAFEERRQRLLEERQRKKDSLKELRLSKTDKNTVKEPTGDQSTDQDAAKDARQLALEARKRRKDSILRIRKARRDSIIAARKNRSSTPPTAPSANDPEEEEGGN